MKSNHGSSSYFSYLVPVTVLTSARADSEVLEYYGQLYQHIDSRQYWVEAQASCENWNGHLVTIGSSGENEFVFDNFVAPGKLPWLGGTDQGSEGDWRWVTGEPWSYTNWWPGEPSDYCENEECDDYLALGDHTEDVWSDVPNAARTFVCEWNTEWPERILNLRNLGPEEACSLILFWSTLPEP